MSNDDALLFPLDSGPGDSRTRYEILSLMAEICWAAARIDHTLHEYEEQRQLGSLFEEAIEKRRVNEEELEKLWPYFMVAALTAKRAYDALIDGQR